MSSNGKSRGSLDLSRTPAAGVAFMSVDSSNHADSRSTAESRSSTGKRSSTSERRPGEHRAHGTSPVNGDIQRALGSVARRAKKRGGFLLESAFANGRAALPETSKSQGTSSELEGLPHVNKRLPSHRFSGESSQRGSPLSREMSLDGTTNHEEETKGLSVHPPTMDPAQLVQMALSLSESRKRNVSNTLQVSASLPSRAPHVLGPDIAYGSVRIPRPESRNTDSQNSRSQGFAKSRHDGSNGDELENSGDGIVYTFSPATLSRAGKARKYFELASEHRRLLEHLPPLRPVPVVPGSYNSSLRNSPASMPKDTPNSSINATLKQGLGRAYNPLQALRNRKLRNRERRPLTAPPDTWQETVRIKNWIDDVAAGCTDPGYLSSEDQVRLPQFEGESNGDQMPQTSAKGHRRSETATSIVTRPENGWTIEPAELLADTYWTEKDDNKTIIEDREGHRIFPARNKPEATSSRRSKESDVHAEGKLEETHDSDTEGGARLKRKNILHIPNRLRRPHLIRTASTASNTSDEGRKSRPHQVGDFEGGDYNIGPLERHMREMIAKDERGELSSPELVSPDHWDSKHTHFPMQRHNVGRTGRESAHVKNRASIDSYRHKRSRSADRNFASDHGMSSMDDMVSESPTSPTFPTFIPAMASDFSQPTSKHASSVEERSGLGRVLVKRSQSKELNNIGHADFAGQTGTPLSPVMSGDDSLPPMSSQLSIDLTRPNHKRKLTAESSGGSSLHRLNTSSTQAPTIASSFMKDSGGASAGRRFFKGGRIGEIVRNEGSRLGDRLRQNRERMPGAPSVISDISRNGSDNSDTEDEAVPRTQTGQIEPSKEISPRTSWDGRPRSKPKYYISNLPSFKSPVGRERRVVAAPSSAARDTDSQQQRVQSVRDRSPRFERLAAPRVKFPDDDGVSSTRLRNQEDDVTQPQEQIYNGSTSALNSVGDLQLNAGGFSSELAHGRRLAIGGYPAGKRHWSISDKLPQSAPVNNRVNARDIARVRALLLASGIKAREIQQKADSTRDTALPMLKEAAAVADRPDISMKKVPRKEEHIVAARVLSEALASRLSSFSGSIDDFHSHTAKNLMQQLAQLQNRAADQLTSLVHETSDDADAFNVELTTKQPQDVKRVDEAVDAMFRQRRRQFRWLRWSGFKILEWMVLGIMWWVWFIVVIINSLRKVTVSIGKGVRWLIWF